MSEPTPVSPATASLHEEQARQRSGKDRLHEGLEDTFPASDPVSHSTTTTAGGPGDPDDDDTGTVEAPKVDEALASVRARSDAGPNEMTTEELRAVRAEVDHIGASAKELVSASGRATRSEVRSLRDTVTRKVRQHPIQALALAALAGYVWGLTR